MTRIEATLPQLRLAPGALAAGTGAIVTALALLFFVPGDIVFAAVLGVTAALSWLPSSLPNPRSVHV